MRDREAGTAHGDARYAGERAIDLLGLATMLNTSEATAYTLANDPLFPSFRVGRQHRFWPSEVRAYLSSGAPWLQSKKSLGRKRVGR
ncbi:helix-turn-helix domain-containing protein [Rathayibacter sp. ZW T2_19]|uniref:Helix-turn-helix domain-containing protein n=1 Tax=Rathayibacter rubneri TaxID=2950106 RepID=A0A9X2DYT6_9MICO|nr:helix-turn-helix domain-containing protein [Rathayibacter rubneri]MCM6761374.1 helix-turn-helix domain-containing protein [Rathayibacter rubneri]